MPAPARAFTVRTIQLLRALFAAVAALMVTFSADHSASVGLSVFSGFAILSALSLALGAWLAVPRGARAPYVLLAIVSGICGMIAGLPPLRSDDLFFALVIVWGLLTGLIELFVGIRGRRSADPLTRDAILIGALSLLLGVALLLIPADYSLQYTMNAGTFELTGIILGVGIFGGYAALVAVFLGIAGFTPAPVPEKSAGTVIGGAA